MLGSGCLLVQATGTRGPLLVIAALSALLSFRSELNPLGWLGVLR